MWALWETKPKFKVQSPRAKHNIFSSEDEDEDQTMKEATECDYEQNCTPLYKKIEGEHFGEVMDFLNTGYWPGAFFADPNPPIEQARTWVTRFEYKDTRKVRWSQLPLHVALLVDAPLVVIKRLVELYPQAVRCTDDQRMLPLHLALRHGGKEETVGFLLKQFPEAVNVKGGKQGRPAIEFAIRGPNKVLGDILETFVERTRVKTAKTAAKSHSKDLEFLQAKLQAKEYELMNVNDRLMALGGERATLERELSAKRKELKLSMQNMEMLSALKLKEIESGMMAESEDATQREEEDQGDVVLELQKTKSYLETAHSEHDELEKRIEDIKEQEIELKLSATQTEAEEKSIMHEIGSVFDQSIRDIKDAILPKQDDQAQTPEEQQPQANADDQQVVEDNNNKGEEQPPADKEMPVSKEPAENTEPDVQPSPSDPDALEKRIEEIKEKQAELKRSATQTKEDEKTILNDIGILLDQTIQDLKDRMTRIEGDDNNFDQGLEVHDEQEGEGEEGEEVQVVDSHDDAPDNVIQYKYPSSSSHKRSVNPRQGHDDDEDEDEETVLLAEIPVQASGEDSEVSHEVVLRQLSRSSIPMVVSRSSQGSREVVIKRNGSSVVAGHKSRDESEGSHEVVLKENVSGEVEPNQTPMFVKSSSMNDVSLGRQGGDLLEEISSKESSDNDASPPALLRPPSGIGPPSPLSRLTANDIESLRSEIDRLRAVLEMKIAQEDLEEQVQQKRQLKKPTRTKTPFFKRKRRPLAYAPTL